MLYKVGSLQPNSPQGQTNVSFQLSNSAWWQIERSAEWRNFLQILKKAQEENIQTDAQIMEDINPEVISSIDTLIKKMADMLSEPVDKGVVRDSAVQALAELITARSNLNESDMGGR